MKNPMELLVELHNMYVDGELASEFDNKRNKMVNSERLKAVMAEVSQVVPPKLDGEVAAHKMRELENRDEAIEASGGKVIDLRKEFQKKMSENGGALGLTKQLVQAIAENDVIALGRITMDMQELVKQSD